MDFGVKEPYLVMKKPGILPAGHWNRHLGERQPEPEYRPVAKLAADTNFAAMVQHDVFDDSEP
jgi:hypothetical protein